MVAELVLGSSLEHDGDGYVGYGLRVRNSDFAAATHTWGGTEEHLRLAHALTGFPASSKSTVRFSFGGSGIGSCGLEFFCLDGSGHIGLWVTVESDSAVTRSQPHQLARVFLRCEPAGIDRFVSALATFTVGRQNVAVLSGLGP